MGLFRFRHDQHALEAAKKAEAKLSMKSDRDRQLEDHLSSLPAPPSGSSTVVAETAFGQGSAAGSAATFSKGDHTHGTPAAPSIPSASSTVVSETSYGQAAAAGSAGTFSKGDHTHGTPAAVRNVYCEIGRNAVQSVANNTDSLVGFNVTDSTSTVDLRSGADIVIQESGRYLVWVSGKWAALNSAGGFGGYRSYHILINGVVKVDVHTSSPETGLSVAEGQTFARGLYLTAGDTVRVSVVQTHNGAPGARDLLGGDAISPILGVKLLDP